jgi:hypothetical protein
MMFFGLLVVQPVISQAAYVTGYFSYFTHAGCKMKNARVILNYESGENLERSGRDLF